MVHEETGRKYEENSDGHIASVTCDIGTIGLFAYYTDEPYVQVQEDNVDADLDHYRSIFYRFSKGYDPEISEETLDGYWDECINNANEGVEFDDFLCCINMDSSGQPYSMVMGGNVK